MATNEDRIAAALAGLPDSCRSAVDAVLRALVHDLSGALSAVNMEAFTVQQVSARLRQEDARPSPRRSAQLDVLTTSAGNLRAAALAAAAHLRRVEAVADEIAG